MKTAIITGACGGIGQTLCRKAAEEGYRVGILDLNREETEKIAADIPEAIPLAADVSNEESIANALQKLGHIPDLLVNNASIVKFGPLLDLAAEDWRKVIDVNLTGYFLMAQAVARGMKARGSGAIINITSINGILPAPYAGGYGTAKAGAALLTQQMALEWAPYGIRVNGVAPGLIDAGMSAPIYADQSVRKARESKVPLGRLGQPQDIAETVLFLASDKSEYITGQNLVIDGGVSMAMISQLPRPKAVDSIGNLQ